MNLVRNVFTIFIVSLTTVSLAQISRGTVQEGLTIKSEILGKSLPYTIYLPYDYNSSERSYPVVYLLHGYTDNHTAWIQFGEANMVADKAIAEQKIPAMILVMPEAGVTWFLNNYDNTVRYEDFFIKEFIPFIESTYRIRTENRYRGISGLSMGGFGALLYSIKYPELFSACSAFSPAIYTKEEYINFSSDRWNKTESIVYGPKLEGEKRITKHLLSNNLLDIVNAMDKKKLQGLRIYIDCGDDDFLYKGNSMFHILLREKQIPHEYRVRDGKHSWTYWRTGLGDGLQFIGESFH